MYSSSRNKTKVRVLVVHTTEGIMRAAALRAWTTWPGSSHASADETGVLLAGAADGFVDYDLAAWTLRSGNPWSENIELCGFAKWKRDEWLSRPLLLEACARWLAARSVARGIPLVKLSPSEYAAGKAGVIGHVDHTLGYADGTHTDPGPNFPYDVVLAKAAAYAGGSPSKEGFMAALSDDQQRQMYYALMEGAGSTGRNNFAWLADRAATTAQELHARIDKLEQRLISDPDGTEGDRLRDVWTELENIRADIKVLADRLAP